MDDNVDAKEALVNVGYIDGGVKGAGVYTHTIYTFNNSTSTHSAASSSNTHSSSSIIHAC